MKKVLSVFLAALMVCSLFSVISFAEEKYPAPAAPANLALTADGIASWDAVDVPAYAETEGYVPVTKKAQQDPAYLEYLSLSGTDNDTHYSIKIDASKLLVAHTSDTFTTPVFNGSASLRDAAGQLIENVTKSVRRKETLNDAYFDKLYSDTTALYHLDQLGGAVGGAKKQLGPLPTESIVLLATLALCWVGICIVALRDRKRAQQG